MFTKQKHRVLSIYPFGRSYAFVLFDSPLSPVDWGMRHVKAGQQSEDIADVIIKQLHHITPDVLVIDDADEHCLRKGKLKRVYMKVGEAAIELDIQIAVVGRINVRAAFAQFGAKNKHQIASVIANNIEAFSHRLPKPRKPWQAEPMWMRLYDAASRALTYYYRLADVRGESTRRV